MGYELSDRDAAILRQLKTKVDNIRGPGVVNLPDGITIMPPPAAAPRPSPPPQKLPVGQYQYQQYGMVSQRQTGFSFVLAHPMTSGEEDDGGT